MSPDLAGLRAQLLNRHHLDPLTEFMREDVTQRLGIIPSHVQWGGQSQQVFSHLAGDFMVDALASIDAILDSGALAFSSPAQMLSSPKWD